MNKDKKPLLEVKDLTTYFHTEAGLVKAVDGISYEVFPGETLGIVGESGCGKSVNALSIMRLLESNADVGGSITFDGQSLPELSEREMRGIRGNDIAMIFQEPMTALNPVFTVGDQIEEAIILHQKKSREDAHQMAIDMLRKVGIPEPTKRVDEYPHELSGGMRQRAMIAMALSCNPRVLIADEPTTALDVTIQAQILELMKSLQDEYGMSLILITHDLGVISHMSNYLYVMYLGYVVEEGKTRELFENPSHPYTRGLLDSIPRLRDDKLAELPG